MAATLETTAPERTTTEQRRTGKDRRRLRTSLVALVVGLILAGIAIGVVGLVVQSRPIDDAPAVFSPEAIRAHNAEGAQQDTFSPEAIRARNAEGAAQEEILSPERYRK